MKVLISGMAALFAAAAFAQSAPTTTEPMTSTPPATETPVQGQSTTPPAAGQSANAPALVEKDGVWWNGERRATTAEIAEYRRANPR
jgi:hypothetical protein